MKLSLRSLFWALLCPGIVAFLGPCLILSAWESPAIEKWAINQYVGLLLAAAGLAGLAWCIYYFATAGRGTLSPLDPAKKLLIMGLYRYVRNPMYLSVIAVILGEIFFFNSTFLVVYAAVVFLAFHGFVMFYEEPYLRRTFGEEYDAYCKKVSRWLPG
ncbi:MAG: isoprenylcysteine carboxylmethyltransferase family protein [Saprospiraceae bacterium]|nr:MAG: isoprenylcysteine carboxylmethyltransferase family protein [Saprospiraceae bacterium]